MKRVRKVAEISGKKQRALPHRRGSERAKAPNVEADGSLIGRGNAALPGRLAVFAASRAQSKPRVQSPFPAVRFPSFGGGRTSKKEP